jgi:hypothetical protein
LETKFVNLEPAQEKKAGEIKLMATASKLCGNLAGNLAWGKGTRVRLAVEGFHRPGLKPQNSMKQLAQI